MEPVEPQDAVLMNFEGWVASDKSVTSGPNFQVEKGWLILVGDGDILPALEMGVRFMGTGQTALIWSHPKYALGLGTRKFMDTTVPPNSSVMYKVTVVQKVVDTSRLNPYFTIQKAITRKKIANDIYQHEWCPPPKTSDDPSCEQSMARATKLYTKAAKEMETLLDGTYFQQVEEDHPQRKESQGILLDALNNIVAVYLRQKDYHEAKLAAVNVLQKDPNNIKALMRAAKAALLDPASTMEEASEAIKAAESEITYKNPEEEKELKRLKVQLKRKQVEYKQKSKEMFGNKLTSAATTTTTNTAAGAGAAATATAKDASKDGMPILDKEDNPVDESDSITSEQQSVKTSAASVVDVNKKGEETALLPTADDDSSYWRTQIYVVLFQVIVPLLIVVLYLRMNNGVTKFDMGHSTGVGGDTTA
jgi:hypothetical protein